MLYHAYYNSPFGCFEITGSYLGIQSVQLVEKRKKQSSKELPHVLTDGITQLDEYFNRKRKVFDLKLDWEGKAEFNRLVWQSLLKIPYGHTTTYSKIAHQIGSPNAVRAVGLANKYNPIAIIVPCHRVIAKNGDLQGYFYGLEMKRKLLELENPNSFAAQGSLF